MTRKLIIKIEAGMIRFRTRQLREAEHKPMRVVRVEGDIIILEDRKI